MKARPHAELIKQWAEGADIQFRRPATGAWDDCPDPAWVSDWEYRVKPSEPESAYLETTMTDDEMREVFFKVAHFPVTNGLSGVWRHFANIAIKHACDSGQIVTRAEFERAVGDRSERDRTIGLNVREGIVEELRKAQFHQAVIAAVRTIDLAAIIADVKP